MSEARYNEVIHKPTGESVSVFKFLNDATWIGRENDELIALPSYCEFGKEVKMIMVGSYPKKNGTIVPAYFRKKSGENGILNTNMSGESDSHRRAKENIRDLLCMGKLKINGELLNLKDISDIVIEYRTAKNGYIIPDVIVLFKDVHPKYGLGIFFEIQFSKQSGERTIERTYSRVIDGFSGVWLDRNSFDDDMNFIGDDIKIESHKSLLVEIERKMENSFIKRINNYGRVIDEKLDTFEEAVNLKTKNNIDIVDMKKDLVMEIVKRLDESYSKWNSLDINNIESEVKERSSNIIKEEVKILNEALDITISEARNNTSAIIKKMVAEEIKNIDIATIISKKCPICKSGMKIGKGNGSYNYKWYCLDYPYCDGIISIKNKDEVFE